MKRPRTDRDEDIRSQIAVTLKNALQKRHVAPETAAKLLEVELGTLYKYLAGSMIPGGHVLWRACRELDLILDENGLRLARSGRRKRTAATEDAEQYELPFINETVAGDKVHLTIRKKDPDYVRVSLRIKIAG